MHSQLLYRVLSFLSCLSFLRSFLCFLSFLLFLSFFFFFLWPELEDELLEELLREDGGDGGAGGFGVTPRDSTSLMFSLPGTSLSEFMATGLSHLAFVAAG